MEGRMFEKWKQKQQVIGMSKLLWAQKRYLQEATDNEHDGDISINMVIDGWNLNTIANNPLPTPQQGASDERM